MRKSPAARQTKNKIGEGRTAPLTRGASEENNQNLRSRCRNWLRERRHKKIVRNRTTEKHIDQIRRKHKRQTKVHDQDINIDFSIEIKNIILSLSSFLPPLIIIRIAYKH
jgi:hypothetical protein